MSENNYIPLLTVCIHGDIRLVGGTTLSEGRVEVCLNNAWGTVCDDGWDTMNAMVVCRQAGFPSVGATPLTNAMFGQGTGDILLDDVACTGIETRLIDCPFTSNHNCAHSEDASVRCEECKQ